ncbi:centrobin isoform X2 [Hypanus sabinus]|uniref:centrobin isoform X2 n=1 Tax=Hypanus sabinus TaxID=79690 RepID=UPI0028C4348C|nr:centrobin isoform X2 [Hypanus sabinus]
MDCPILAEDLLSDVEPLSLSAPSSAPVSPSPSRAAPSVTIASARSLPASPSTVLANSSEVTTRLYASLRANRQLGLWPAPGGGEEPSGKHSISGSLTKDATRPDCTMALSRRQASASAQGEMAEHGGASVCTDRPCAKIPGSQPFIGLQDGILGTSLAHKELIVNQHPKLTRLTRDKGSAGHLALPDLEELAVEMTQRLSKRAETSSGPKAGSRHISEMESVRSHLHSMLKFSQDLTHRSDTISPADEQRRDDDPYESECTSSLLSAKPFQEMSVSPPGPMLELDEATLFPRYSRMQLTTGPVAASSLYEYQILKDTLDKERTRRKHCEKQIQILQNKILELQQQLAVAVSADRKKDIMIEQLDKTLAKVVEGWKKHDTERSEVLKHLQEEHEVLEQERGERQQALLNFEHHLSQANQALAKELQEKERLEKERGLLEDEAQQLREALQAEQQHSLKLQADCDRAEGGWSQERQQTQTLQAQLAEERATWSQQEQQLQQRSAQREEELQEEIEKERAATQQEAQRGRDAQLVLSAVQTEMQRLEGELDTVSRDREGLQMELSLVKARFESQRVKSETEFKVALEQQVAERLTAAHEDSTQQMAAIRDQHRKQIMELTTQHEHEMGKQLAEFKLELQEREEKHRHVIEGYELRLAKGQEETGRLLTAKRKLEIQRSEMVSKLQTMMQSHWNEALKVLMSENIPQGPQQLQQPTLLCDQVPFYRELNRSLPAWGGPYGRPCVEADLLSCPVPPASDTDQLKFSFCSQSPVDSLVPHQSEQLVRDIHGSEIHARVQIQDHQATGGRVEGGGPPETTGACGSSAFFPRAIPLQPVAKLVPTAAMDQTTEPCLQGDNHGEAEHPSVTISLQDQQPVKQLLPNPPSVEHLSHLLNYSFLSHNSFQPLEPQVDETIQAPGPQVEELAEHPFTESEAGTRTQSQRLSEGGTVPDSSFNSSGDQSLQDQSSRSSELQYYIQMLLDRSPGNPVDTSGDVETPNIMQHSAETQQMISPCVPDHSGNWEVVRPQPMGQLSATQNTRPPSSAVQKVKLGPSESVSVQKSGIANGVLSPKEVGELSRLLSLYNSNSDHAAPSVDELFTYLRHVQANRPRVPEGLAPTALRNQDQKLNPTAKKESLPSQKRVTSNRPENRPSSSKDKRRGVLPSQGGGSRGAKAAIWR